MHMDDKEAAEFYANPENLRPAGKGRQRSGGTLSSHVPVRFSPSLIAAVKRLADLDGVTISTWIRNLVTREVERRATPITTSGHITTVNWDFGPGSSTSPVTSVSEPLALVH
jgi:hypothetical protein